MSGVRYRNEPSIAEQVRDETLAHSRTCRVADVVLSRTIVGNFGWNRPIPFFYRQGDVARSLIGGRFSRTRRRASGRPRAAARVC